MSKVDKKLNSQNGNAAPKPESHADTQAENTPTPKDGVTYKKVPAGWVIVSVSQNDATVYDFLKESDLAQTLKNIEKIKGDKPTVAVFKKSGEDYDVSIVGEKDPKKLADNGGVSVKELNAISGCTTC